MEKDRKTRMIAIAALVVGVVGLSLGFAAFSNTLTIKSSAEVTPDDSIFNVDFSKQSASVVDGTVTPTLSPATGAPAEFVGADATIDNSSDPVIRGLHATFTEPGQNVTYSFYTKNAGALKAYLKNVNFANATGASSTKVCTAKAGDNPATQSLVDTACQGISLTMTLGSESFTASKARDQFATATAHDLEVAGYEPVTVVIDYAAGSAQADGDFDVAFGDITLLYSSNAD